MVNQTGRMSSYTVQVAKTHLSRLLHEVEEGGEVTILRGDRPVARLVPVSAPAARQFGSMEFVVPDDFDEPLPEDEVAAWE